MKTIAIIIPEGWAVKGYLLNDFIDILSKKLKVIVFTPLAGENIIEDKYNNNNNVIIEKLILPQQGMVYDELDNFFTVCHTFRANRVAYIRIFDKWHKRLYDTIDGFRIRSFVKHKVIRKLSHVIAKSVGIYIPINLQLRIEKFFYRSLYREAKRIEKKYIEYKVDLVFSTQPLMAYFDRPGVWAAQRLGLTTISTLTAWDNLSTKGRMPIHYSHYLVWSEWMREELIKTHPDIDNKLITPVGPPDLDFHFNNRKIMSKEKFCSLFNLDIHRPIILFSPGPSGQSPNQPEMVERVYLAMKDGSIKNNPQLFVRSHPVGDFSYWESFKEKYPQISFSEYGGLDGDIGRDWNPTMTDLDILIASLYHCSLMINFSSTITLEAFIYDKPVINIAYDFDRESFFHEYTANAYSVDSYRPVVETKSTKIAYSNDDVVRYANEYLKNPKLDSENRKKLLKLIVGFVDGKTHRRIIGKIFEIMEV